MDSVSMFADPRGAPILIAGANFGRGSSREHAVWAMLNLGIRAVIAESYSDIFADNAFKNGLLAVALHGDLVGRFGHGRGPAKRLPSILLHRPSAHGWLCPAF